jgi:phospholipase C
MKLTAKLSLLLTFFCPAFAHAQISNFSHIVVIIQENRGPDNLFYYLCSTPYGSSKSCSTSPTDTQYDILTSNWLDKTASKGVTQPISVELDNTYDVSHSHDGFTTTCDVNTSTGICRMDGAAETSCTGCTGVAQPHYRYVDNSTGILNPYLTLATSYGWANYMFETQQGPTFPAHQFLFGGTSAPSAADDAIATFADSNMYPAANNPIAGCIAPSDIHVDLIEAGQKTGQTYPCFDHTTIADLMENVNVSWHYYNPGLDSIVTAPNAIDHICEPSEPSGGTCTGTEFTDNVITPPKKVLTDISGCNLAGMVWVTPSGENSDHASSNDGGGPAWVASIVNSIGNNPKCKSGENYWDDTAIIITWDDWGGWYDHEPPTILAGNEGDFQYGFRVPFMVVSAYTPVGYIDNTRMDWGTVLRFIEQNWGIEMGTLGFADARSTTDMTEFFNLEQAPRSFVTIPADRDASFFINDDRPMTEPDDY